VRIPEPGACLATPTTRGRARTHSATPQQMRRMLLPEHERHVDADEAVSLVHRHRNDTRSIQDIITTPRTSALSVASEGGLLEDWTLPGEAELDLDSDSPDAPLSNLFDHGFLSITEAYWGVCLREAEQYNERVQNGWVPEMTTDEMARRLTATRTGIDDVTHLTIRGLDASGVVEEGLTLHVRGVGADNSETYESEAALRKLFEQFGGVKQATVRHRVNKDGRNTSWALVTMRSAKAARAAVQAGPLQPADAAGLSLQVEALVDDGGGSDGMMDVLVEASRRSVAVPFAVYLRLHDRCAATAMASTVLALCSGCLSCLGCGTGSTCRWFHGQWWSDGSPPAHGLTHMMH
jgi:hypothetical protein